MTKQELLQCIRDLNRDWRCKYGLLHTRKVEGEDRNNPTLNGVLYTGIATAMVMLAAAKLEMEEDPEVQQFVWMAKAAFDRCAARYYPLINRTPENQDQQGPDDYKGLCAFLATSRDVVWARDLLDKGAVSSVKLRPWLPKLGRWLNNSGRQDRVYDQLPSDTKRYMKIIWSLTAPYGSKPWVAPWLGRFPALTESLEATAERSARFIPTVFSFLSIMQQALIGNNKKPDSWYMDWTIIVAAKMDKTPNRLLAFASKLWFKRLKKLYPNGLKDVWRDYVEPPYKESFPLARFFYEAEDLLA